MIGLASGLWVDAYMMRLGLDGIPCYLRARGDATAGAIMVKLATMDGQAVLFQRRYDVMADTRRWEEIGTGDEREIDARIERERGRDRDLWVVEVEDARGRHLLDDPSLA